MTDPSSTATTTTFATAQYNAIVTQSGSVRLFTVTDCDPKRIKKDGYAYDKHRRCWLKLECGPLTTVDDLLTVGAFRIDTTPTHVNLNARTYLGMNFRVVDAAMAAAGYERVLAAPLGPPSTYWRTERSNVSFEPEDDKQFRLLSKSVEKRIDAVKFLAATAPPADKYFLRRVTPSTGSDGAPNWPSQI